MSIDFRTLPQNVPILCIPRVYSNISESRIRRIFEDLDMGTLERIDMVSKQSDRGEKFNRVFVHFHRWNNTANSCEARSRLLNGKEVKIIYDDPWFWKVSAYRETERRPENDRRPENGPKKPTLQFDSEDNKRPARHEERPRPRQEDRSRPRQEDRSRPRHEDRPRPRQEDRPRPRPRSPTNPHPEASILEVNYGTNTKIPTRNIKIKKPIKIEEDVKDLEEGEVSEN